MEDNAQARVRAMMAPALANHPHTDAIAEVLLPAYTRLVQTMGGLDARVEAIMNSDAGDDEVGAALQAYMDGLFGAIKALILEHPTELRPAALASMLVVADASTPEIAPTGHASLRAALASWYEGLGMPALQQGGPLAAVQ